jgi:WhiB family transcriptional regulator, redox-sensing transcriptional regulator
VLRVETWKEKAKCREMNTSFFFYDFDAGNNDEWLVQAKAICESCEVMAECLSFALENGEVDGVWGGTTPAERRKMRRKAPKPRSIEPYLKDRAPHGTPARRQQHYRDGQKPCQVCVEGLKNDLVDAYWEKKRASR